MTVATTLIPGLDDIVRNGDPKLRAEAARRIAELFLQDAAHLRPKHVDLFDEILVDLVPHAELVARAELAERLSLIANAPPVLIGRLARENEILVAGPVLRRSPVLGEDALLEIARIKGQGHLLAISERPKLSADLTDVIVERGDREVVRRAAGNAGAMFSESGYNELIKRASQDGVLTLAVGQRGDLSDVRLKQLLAGSIDVVRHRLHDVVKPERRNAIKLAVAEITGVPERFESKRDFVPAQRIILALREAGNLNEAALLGFAKSHRYEESVAALAAMSGVKISTLDNLVSGDRFDPILIVGKTIGLEWATVRALILMRLGPNRVPAPSDIESARVNFARLMPSTAERVVGFWKTR
ncbi:MAG TPA: DUF2336 domain-containing protein [Bradyrhizobium sp.]|uniref:DUF2336 domain-containing protein n=1 Tax=Bradyrhizobium sp. TaxID=376 RepID=UPI002C3DFB48|nr:DUF2336 domain-containing protein [Bradyrhizobium sp.]HLZ04637.1 DUF2336 domain-containing protein [Bradyrhizobium sp.]